jgi:hypothetical protein
VAIPYDPLSVVQSSTVESPTARASASASTSAASASSSSSSSSAPARSSPPPLSSPSQPKTTTTVMTETKKRRLDTHTTAASTMATGDQSGGGVGGDSTMTDVDSAMTHGDEDTNMSSFTHSKILSLKLQLSKPVDNRQVRLRQTLNCFAQDARQIAHFHDLCFTSDDARNHHGDDTLTTLRHAAAASRDRASMLDEAISIHNLSATMDDIRRNPT